ncbi:MAG: type IV pilus biogenesis/stability protein PilW [Metallibacterium scheffleri]
MRLENFLPVLLAAGLLALGGCASTGSSDSLHTSSANKALDAAQIHTQLGEAYMQRGDLKGALAKLQLALKYDDNYVPAHTVLAVLYERIGEYGNAEHQYRRVLDLEPKSGSANNNLGAFLCRTGKVEESLQYFTRAAKDPFYQTPYAAYTNAGVCLIKIHKLAEAAQQFHDALSINPKFPEALYQSARVWYLQGNAFRASAYLQRLESLGPAGPDTLKLGYEIETKLGDTASAKSYRDRLIEQYPDSAQAKSLSSTGSQP